MRLAPRLSDDRWFSWQVDLRLTIFAFVVLYLSVRNVSARFPVVIESARYYDSHGRLVRDHLPKPAELAALARVEFVVKEGDTAGGPGANLLVITNEPQ
jgi:hypothetical protein